MAIAKTNWQSFLSADSDLPPDVFFLVKTEAEEENGGDVDKKFGAHRLFLAGVSPVFKAMFYGLMKETTEVIEVKGTTPEAFDTMVKYIYHPPAGEAFNLNHMSCPQRLFELLTLSTKYQFLDLSTMTSGALEKLMLTSQSVIFTASVAKNYKTSFDNQSVKLSMKCLKFLLDNIHGGSGMFALINETKVNFPGANFDILQELRALGYETLQLQGTFCYLQQLCDFELMMFCRLGEPGLL